MNGPWLPWLLVAAIVASQPAAAAPGKEEGPAWARAHLQPPITAAETRQLMRELAQFLFDNHLKKKADSPQGGMVYEYLDVRRKGQFDQFVQGEALDTMHDGAWLAAALATAYRATGDPFYKEFLARWLLPFYLKMLNHSDELFSARRNDARPDAHVFARESAFQEGERGFVPYFWDDGGSVSLERRGDKNLRGPYPCFDRLAGRPNPSYLLDGYSLGSSNHMAQDLGVMLQVSWLLLKDSGDPADRKLAAEVAEAARNLHESRMRHHGPIPMCVAPAALANADAELMKKVPPADDPRYGTPDNHYVRATVSFRPGQNESLPGFADDQQYRYYYGIARSGGRVPEPLAFKTIYDASTQPLLYRCYSDDAAVPPGINVFDLHPYYFRDGKPLDYRSDRKGPGGGPRPIGSRMGPQNMIVCGWALQMLRAHPGIWRKYWELRYPGDFHVFMSFPLPDGVTPPGRRLPSVPGVWIGGVRVDPESTPSALKLTGTFADAATIKVFSRPDAKGAHAAITLNRNGGIAAANDRGEPLVFDGKVTPAETATHFSLVLPYTVVKGQKPWLNGIQCGRCSIAVGNEVQNFVLASSEEQLKGSLEHELAGGLRTWQAIFREKGYIPTGIGAGRDWDHFSDAGGYAHLIAAAAQWLFYLEGKRDWEEHHVPQIRDGR